MHNKNFKIVTAIGIFVILGIVYFFLWNDREDSAVFVPDAEETTSETALDVSTETALEISSEPVDIYVYVCGYVNSPGVYILKEGARMYEAVELAGGVSEDGCADCLPMAMTVSDGERVYIPSREEAKNITYAEDSDGSTQNEETTGRIDLNKASKEQLMTLPGIGAAKADAIIVYRKEHGDFTCIEDVMNIPGIKEAAFSKMKDYICVSF